MTKTNIDRSMPKSIKQLITFNFYHDAVVKQNHYVVRICSDIRSCVQQIKRVFKYCYMILHYKIRAFPSIGANGSKAYI